MCCSVGHGNINNKHSFPNLRTTGGSHVLGQHDFPIWEPTTRRSEHGSGCIRPPLPDLPTSPCSTSYGTMPVPRLSQSAEAARAAALQAEFNEKKWVWVPDDKEGYLAGWVVKEEEDMGEVVIASGGEVCTLLHPLYTKALMLEQRYEDYRYTRFRR